MQVYKKINSAVEEKKVTSYDQELMNFLVTHKDLSNDKITNYYDSLQSTYSISKCYRFIRYLALGLDIEQIKVCEGYLAAYQEIHQIRNLLIAGWNYQILF